MCWKVGPHIIAWNEYTYIRPCMCNSGRKQCATEIGFSVSCFSSLLPWHWRNTTRQTLYKGEFELDVPETLPWLQLQGSRHAVASRIHLASYAGPSCGLGWCGLRSVAGSRRHWWVSPLDLWNQRWCWMQNCLAKPKRGNQSDESLECVDQKVLSLCEIVLWQRPVLFQAHAKVPLPSTCGKRHAAPAVQFVQWGWAHFKPGSFCDPDGRRPHRSLESPVQNSACENNSTESGPKVVDLCQTLLGGGPIALAL